MKRLSHLVNIGMLICMVYAAGINKGYCDSKTEQVLIMGAQRDFQVASEGKLLVFDTLVTLDPSGMLLPELAVRWDVSDDGKKMTFFLRQNVKYHDNTRFDARSAKFAIERARTNAVWAKYVDDIKIIDDYTLQVVFNTYYYPFLLSLANGWQSECFVSPVAVDPPWDPKGKIVRYIGTGPFKLADYKKDREATLLRNDDYWGKIPKLNKLIWKYTPDPYAQILALKAGELDMIGAPEHHSSVPFMKLGELKADPDLVVSVHSYGRYQVLDFNCEKPPFNDLRVRKALNYAIDRQTMVSSLFGDIAEPSYLITDPKFVWGPSNIRKGYEFDLKRARELLTEAGWRDTDGNGILDKDGKNFEIELLVPTGEANADMVVLVVQSQLRDLGIIVSIKNIPDAWDQLEKGAHDLFLGTSGCLPSIAGGIGIGDKYHSKGTSYAYHSDELDLLIEAAFTTTGQTRMRRKCDEIWTLLHHVHPCIPLYDITKAVVMNKKVQGFRHGPTMFDMDLSDIEIVE